MTNENPEKMGLAAGFVTFTLDENERLKVEALIASDPDFAALVASYRKRLSEDGCAGVPEKIWGGIESRLTDENH